MRTVQLFMLLCCVAGSAQQTEKIVFADIDSIRFYERFMIEAGMRMPLGSLADKVGASPEFGFWFRSRMRNSDMFDLGFSVYVPTQVKDFKYTDRGNTYNVKASGASGMAGFGSTKCIPSVARVSKKALNGHLPLDTRFSCIATGISRNLKTLPSK